jgi:hypothetical protein
MSFEPENDLERALVRAAREEDARPEFYRLLLESQLFVIGDLVDSKLPENTEGTVPAGAKLRLAAVTHEGQAYNLVFTALSRLEAFTGRPERNLRLQGRELFTNTRGAHFMLNPGADYGKDLLPDEIAYLLDSPSEPRNVTFDKETQVLIGTPSVYPHALIDALKSAFAKRSDIISAHLLYIAYQGKNEAPHPIIGVQISGDWADISKEIGRALQSANSGTVVDALPLDAASESPVEQALLKTPPFYSR